MSPVGSIHGAKSPGDRVALTFDDGPDPDVTPRLLDLLHARGARATFFLLTEKVLQQPDVIRRMMDDGHEIGLHFDRHDRLTEMPIEDVRKRLRDARRQLEAVVGPIRYFRPPFGAQSLATYLLARFEGLDVVSWGPYAEDWKDQPPAMAAGKALDGVRGGEIVLLHDGLEVPAGEVAPVFDRVRMVELILDGLAERGLQCSTVGDLLAAGGPRRTIWFRR